jgi:hypothetical protein
MNNRTVIGILTGWVILTLVNYYYTPPLIVALSLILLLFIFLIMIIVHVSKLIKERKNIRKDRLRTLILISTIFVLTIFHRIPHRLVEKMDWYLQLNNRIQIVEKVKRNEIIPNVTYNNWICELPYEFPVVSTCGNDIGIFKNSDLNTVTVRFFVNRAYISFPSTYFVYTNDQKTIERIDLMIAENPKQNWILEENWYRVVVWGSI